MRGFPRPGAGGAALSGRIAAIRSSREAAFDVATAVTGDFVKLTNGPWAFSIEQTRRALGLDRLLVINDFTALALAVPLLKPRGVAPGRRRRTPCRARRLRVIGAGTGLGVSGLIPAGERWMPHAGRRRPHGIQPDGRARRRRAALCCASATNTFPPSAW